jgi:hypothetical protein
VTISPREGLGFSAGNVSQEYDGIGDTALGADDQPFQITRFVSKLRLSVAVK